MNYRNILLIDDDDDDQELFQLALGEIGRNIHCKVVTSAKEALHYLGKATTTTDLIFLDLNMPIMTGQQFLAELNKHPNLSGIPVVVLSTSSDTATISHAYSLGAGNFY